MARNQSLAGYLKDADDRIEWVLSHPKMSDWLKDALRGARKRDPEDLLNDLAVLDQLLKRRAEAQIEISLSRLSHSSGEPMEPGGWPR
ncbi:hypothetical protein [Mesorhizobium sp. Z1-4]|uniref:hypothetical protein n=1 Tax=Mesorhizobium sp. Z1-4 TaxID=2448478 RepID=UPI000FD88868|nr:hypothetical protein [Mesorhizobium sp. Z1-4]